MSSPIRRVLSVVSPRFGRPIVCEACGKEFSCGMSLRGCWCSEIELSDETRAELKALYKDCLCRECLERFAASVD